MLSRMNYRTMSGQLNLSKGNRKVKTTAWLDVGLNKKGKKKRLPLFIAVTESRL